jgi:hypothetical protein
MKKILLLVAVLAISYKTAIPQPCLPEGITFTTQAQIDSFQINYPYCTEIEGDVIIHGDIKNLNGLSGITSISGSLDLWGFCCGSWSCYPCVNDSLIDWNGLKKLTTIGGSLRILGNGSLTSLNGLDNLASIGGSLLIMYNSSLTYLTGLEALTSIGGSLTIADNSSLTHMTGLEALTSIGGDFTTYSNSSLTNLVGLNNVATVGGSVLIGGINSICGELRPCTRGTSLTNLMGLNNLTSIGGNLIINHNIALTTLEGLDKLASIGGSLQIGGYSNHGQGPQYNPILTSLSGLKALTSIGGGLEISHNASLTSLSGLDNINTASISNLSIFENNSLSNCAAQSICDLLAIPGGMVDINDNANGCNSPEEVKAAFTTASVDKLVSSNNRFTIYPNPATNKITISTSRVLPGETIISITSISGQQLQRARFHNQNKFEMDVSTLSKGIYLVKIQTNTGIETKKLVIQ